MGKVIVNRLGRLLLTLLAVTFLTFSLTEFLPGDPAIAVLGEAGAQNPELIEQVRDELGLDRNFFVRYADWLGDAVRGDLGKSYLTGQTVSDAIKDRLPITAELAFLAVVLALIVAIPIGILGAYRQGRWQDTVSSAGVQVALSVPNFIIGLFFVYLFANQLGWFPNTGWARLSEKGVVANLETAIMPASALAMTQLAIFSRLIRADMIATLQENYILAARAKGLSDRFILVRHALRPSSLSLMTIVGINFGALLGGTVIIEELFAVPGLGRRLFEAINKRDILVIQGITAFIAFVYVVINTVVDLLYAVVDPRIRKG